MSDMLPLAQSAIDHTWRLTTGGWVVMILSVGFVTLLLSWCIWRVTRESSPKKLHSHLEVDKPDQPEQ